MPPSSSPTAEDTTSIPPISIDPHIVPWSYRGSYMCFATRSGDGGKLSAANNDICLVTHIYPWGCPLFALRPNLPNTKRGPPSGFHKDPSSFQFKATPSCLQWSLDAKVIAEATFQDERIIRLKGSLPMSFDTEGKLGMMGVDHWRTWMYRVPGPRSGCEEVEFTSTPDTSLKFVALKGKFEVEIEDKSIDVYLPNNRRLTISATEGDDVWELAIIEREREPGVVLPKLGFPLIKTVKDEMAKSFEEYMKDLCPWQKDWGSKQGQTDQLGCYVMWTSTVRPAGYFKKEAVLMSKLWMNKVWSWDNCFNCLALAQAYPDIAIDQMMIPFDWITPEGRLPDSMAHSEILYDYTKPPIYGWTTFKLLGFLASGKQSNIFEAVSTERLTELYDKISKNTMFWYNCRKAEGLRIPWYTHGNDSGWDNATCYDRQTIAASPDLAAFLVVQNDFLAQTAHHLGDAKAEKDWKARRDDMVDALLELWDDENRVFQFQDAYDLSKWSTPTLLKYIPLVASAHLPSQVVESMTTGLRAHLTEWGLATEDPKSKDYDPDGYWRGPIWAPPTILIESGLRVAGEVEFADEISGRFQRLCEKSGFAENYNAITGEGNRDLSYTWSASTYLVLRREQEEREAGKA